jgi:hypothetical protein
MLSLSPEAPTVVSRHELNEPETWTVPTLVGTTLYVRDHTRVRAYDLARQGS